MRRAFDHLRERIDGQPGGLDRRRFLGLLGGGALAASGGRVGYEVTGYGTISGTNLLEQDLAPLARRRLALGPFEHDIDDTRVGFDGERLTLAPSDGPAHTLNPFDDPLTEIEAAGAEVGLGDDLRRFARDVRAMAAGDFVFEFTDVDDFFDRVEPASTRPLTVAALRGANYTDPPREAVREFTNAALSRPRTIVSGLAAGFREHASFDVPRYVVKNIQDHVLLGAVSLEWLVSDDTSFTALADGSTGLYCWEYTLRSIEALHVSPPHEQSPPVFGAIVLDDRHNHMYTGMASVVRTGAGLRIPMTFLDYSHSTLYDTYHLRWLFGDSVDAYDTHHRTSGIHYSA